MGTWFSEPRGRSRSLSLSLCLTVLSFNNDKQRAELIIHKCWQLARCMHQQVAATALTLLLPHHQTKTTYTHTHAHNFHTLRASQTWHWLIT